MATLNPKKNKQPKAKSLQQARKERAKLYGTTKWKKLRLHYMLYHPLCEQCLKDNRTTPATQIHHKDSFMNYTDSLRIYKFYEYENLMALCEECHGKIHGEHGKTTDI